MPAAVSASASPSAAAGLLGGGRDRPPPRRVAAGRDNGSLGSVTRVTPGGHDQIRRMEHRLEIDQRLTSISMPDGRSSGLERTRTASRMWSMTPPCLATASDVAHEDERHVNRALLRQVNDEQVDVESCGG